MFRNHIGVLLKVQMALILTLLPGTANDEIGKTPSGICPTYIGPVYPTQSGAYCTDLIMPGPFNLVWAHEKKDWVAINLGEINLVKNMRYMLTYNSDGGSSVELVEDSGLAGNGQFCFTNNGPDGLKLCLDPIDEGFPGGKAA
jgi:hypothetical protein